MSYIEFPFICLGIFTNQTADSVGNHSGNEAERREELYSRKVRAGKRTYFIDVKSTRSEDYYLTITESKRKPRGDGFSYEKHKIFLYKEDFDKFAVALNDCIEHIKEDLMPDTDFGAYVEDEEGETPPRANGYAEQTSEEPSASQPEEEPFTESVFTEELKWD